MSGLQGGSSTAYYLFKASTDKRLLCPRIHGFKSCGFALALEHGGTDFRFPKPFQVF